MSTKKPPAAFLSPESSSTPPQQQQQLQRNRTATTPPSHQSSIQKIRRKHHSSPSKPLSPSQKRQKYQSYYDHKRDKALKKRSETLEQMFRLETQKTMEIFGIDENGSSQFAAFHQIVRNIFNPLELPEEYRGDVDGLILALDEDKSGTLEVDEVNAFFKEIFKGKIQSKGFKRVRELKRMQQMFEIAQDTTLVRSYLLISNADHQLDTFLRSFVSTAELYNNPILELSDQAPREIDPKKIDSIVYDLIEDAIDKVLREGRLYFDDVCIWYLERLGG
eukprot:CAMPEP_0117444818 /NCGR_PEP_ID=MMETSP0759-20121206/5454_1 /TAXON_ID=63605 /ORGANISM="Percolomonas cosmopolitus, Strain WS" /LENGTH=276 /DNA_ID=CAMNT_0005236931 /DNA_START=8 /DNA_END=834 /DNA_ORIENTATION=-